MNKKHFIIANKLYILSGISASGKSSLLRKFKEQGFGDDAIIGVDDVRRKIFGVSKEIDSFGVKENLYGWEVGQQEIFNIVKNMLRLRMREKLTTFFDATNLTDSDRSEYVKIAAEYGMDSEIIILDVPIEKLYERLSKRMERFDGFVIDKQKERFQKTSRFNHILLSEGDEVICLPNLVDTLKVDIVGDVHGLLSELVGLLKISGWEFDKTTFIHKDPDRKLLFLGDIVDRGEDSLEVLSLVSAMCKSNKAYFLLGNHEHKLLKCFHDKKDNGVLRGRSFSNAETYAKVLRLDESSQAGIYDFLNSSPSQLTLWYDTKTSSVVNAKNYEELLINKDSWKKIGFVHSDINFYNPYGVPASVLYYGRSKLRSSRDTDKEYQVAVDRGLNDHIIIRGHIPNTSKQSHIYSLDDLQAFSGNMKLLQLDKYIETLRGNSYEESHLLFEKNVITFKSNFNYNEYIKEEKMLYKELEILEKEKLVKSKKYEDLGLRIYKYDNKVFYDNLWHKHELIKKARGLVLDFAGNIVQHPFDKIFNFGENEAGNNIPLDTIVQVIEKLNGFMGCVGKNPFKSNELLLSTTGSLDSDFVTYINDFIDSELKGKLLSFFSKNDLTLMFEVIHKDDPHIVKYEEKDHGLWLIGARGKEFNSKILSEEELDEIANSLGFRRPNYFNTTFGDVINNLKSHENEGYLIRDLNSGDPLLKIKTDYYLLTKFIGRLGKGNIKAMFANPERFKQDKIEEEFYPLVDKIVFQVTVDEFGGMTPENRVVFVRGIIDEIKESNKYIPNSPKI